MASPHPDSATRSELGRHAARAEADVRAQMRYWRSTTGDRRFGGYRVRDYGAPRLSRLHRWRARQHAAKQVVAQSRLVWTFAHAYLAGWGTDADLRAARHGLDFLSERFWDAQDGGWIWQTARDGTWLDDRKNLIAQVSVLLALVEYARATDDPDARRQADETFALIEQRHRDHRRGGWVENYSRDWSPADPDGVPLVDRIGGKSANVTLHVMETYAEYAALSGELVPARALADAIGVMREQFLHGSDPSAWLAYRADDWSVPDDPAARARSYGHDVEYAWLAVHAERVLGREPDWDAFFLVVDDALHNAFDHERGGLRHDSTKVWWVQGELVAALLDADAQRPDSGYDRALLQTLEFADAYLVDPADRVWFEIVADDGTVTRRTKAHDWKSTYHDVRALVKLARAYG